MFSKSFLPGKLWWWDNRVGDTAQWVPTNPFLHSLLLRERESRERGMRREMEGTIKGCYASVFRSDVISPKKNQISFCGIWFFNKEKHKSWAASTETETSMLLKRNMKGYLRSIKNRIKYINWMMLTQSFKKIFSSFDIYIYMFCILYSWHTCNIILEIVLARALLTDPPLLNFPHTLQNKNIPSLTIFIFLHRSVLHFL